MSNKSGKKNKLMDRLLTIVLILCGVVILGMVIMIPKQKHDEEVAANATPTPTVAPTATPFVDPEYIATYQCMISEGSGEGTEGASNFVLELDYLNKTFKRLLNSDDKTSDVAKGTFSLKDGYIETVSSKGATNKLVRDGKYLVTENALYEGDVPEGKTFDLTATTKNEDAEVHMKFKKNGIFSVHVVSYESQADGSDTKTDDTGKYYRKGNFIYRTKKDGTELMPIYIYQGRLCTNYYKAKDKGSKVTE
ncbi:MAG: hypothetical protein K6G62_01710 [Eubacterium sp.]|nr:hypothetical protein [Eubacterium sp.]